MAIVPSRRWPVNRKQVNGHGNHYIYQGASGSGEELAEEVAQSLGYGCNSREVLIEASLTYGMPEAKLNELKNYESAIIDPLGVVVGQDLSQSVVPIRLSPLKRGKVCRPGGKRGP